MKTVRHTLADLRERIGWFILLLLLAGCRSHPTPFPEPGSFQWATYTHTNPGYTVQYPDVFTPFALGNTVAFQYRDTYVMRIVFVEEDEARNRGLWASHAPVGPVHFGGRTGQRYTYDHHDGPFYLHTVAWVVPVAGRFLGLEFRTDADTLNAVQQHIVDTFQVH